MSSRRRVRSCMPSVSASGGGSGGTPTGGDTGLFITEQALTFSMSFSESNAAQTEAVLSAITATTQESNAAQTEAIKANMSGSALNDTVDMQTEGITARLSGSAFNESVAAQTEAIRASMSGPALNDSVAVQTEAIKASMSGSALNDSVAAQTEARSTLSRYFATTTSDNDSSRTTPTNANGQPDSTNATIRTNLVIADLTNPVVLTTTVFGSIPTTGTYVAKTLRVFFSIAARITTADTIVLQYSHSGGAFTTFYTHTGTAAVNHLTNGLTFDVSSLTLTQAASIQMRGSYTANVVATPETAILLDAWCVELQRTE